MRIGNVYAPGALTCKLTDPLTVAAYTMVDSGVGALAIVSNGGGLDGIISERDLARAVAREVDPRSATVEAYASSAVFTADVEEDSTAAINRMLDGEIRHLPVLEHGRVVGMLSIRDLLAVEAWG